MTSQLLSIDELITGLESFPNYHALDVFGSSVREVVARAPVPGLVPVNERSFTLTRNGRTYTLDWYPDRDVLRLSRAPAANAQAVGAGAGAIIGAATAQAALTGLIAGGILGLLVGAALGGATAAERRVFTLTFDPNTRRWYAYDGGLVPWMKQQLMVP